MLVLESGKIEVPRQGYGSFSGFKKRVTQNMPLKSTMHISIGSVWKGKGLKAVHRSHMVSLLLLPQHIVHNIPLC